MSEAIAAAHQFYAETIATLKPDEALVFVIS
jgi:hypothetical protein